MVISFESWFPHEIVWKNDLKAEIVDCKLSFAHIWLRLDTEMNLYVTMDGVSTQMQTLNDTWKNAVIAWCLNEKVNALGGWDVLLGLTYESMNLLQPLYTNTNCAQTTANSNDCSMIGQTRRTVVAMVTQPSLSLAHSCRSMLLPSCSMRVSRGQTPSVGGLVLYDFWIIINFDSDELTQPPIDWASDWLTPDHVAGVWQANFKMSLPATCLS